MPDRETTEDPIEAIKRRNEERAAKLREKLAAEGADTFETSIDGTGEPETTPAEEFDLGSFPPPPEPEEVPVGESPAAVTEPPAAGEPGVPDIELPPPPEAAGTAIPDAEMPPAPDLEIEITPPEGVPDIPPTVTAGAEVIGPDLDIDIAPPDMTEIPVASEEAAKIAEIELPEEVEFPLPEAWEGAEAPETEVAAAEEPVAEAAVIEEEIEPPVIEGLELPEIPTIEVPVGEIVEPVAAAPEPVPTVEIPEVPELKEEEPVVPVEEPKPVPVEPVPEPAEVVAEEPLAVEPTVTEPAVVGEPVVEELTIKVAIEVTGTKVRITRENIALDGAVDLFRKIIERYENR
ncbi:MAG: hypothetical protein JSW52_11100 [Candidatus Coatesbacteria bacterium]|nr:MAG: hypothetical protein JSW52_11100 [Candidatus Coatesbacteria bacterium]